MWSRYSSLIREIKSSKSFLYTGYSGGSAIVGRYSSKLFAYSTFVTFLLKSSQEPISFFGFSSLCPLWLPKLDLFASICPTHHVCCYLRILETTVVLHDFQGCILLFQLLEILLLYHKVAMRWFLHWLPWLSFHHLLLEKLISKQMPSCFELAPQILLKFCSFRCGTFSGKCLIKDDAYSKS